MATAIEAKLKALPAKPGVYLMKNEAGDVIYVGKALSLRSRVRSYFQKGGQRTASAKVRALVEHVADLETIVTATEIDALVLESNLIKEMAPKYNVRLKDDKHFPYLKVTDEPYPRVIVVRRMGKGGRTFGPYTNAQAVRTTMAFLRKLFPIRTCSLDLSGELNYRPCLLYHIGRCGAPCAGLQSEEEYTNLIDEVCLFLEGRHDKLLPGLRRKMEEASSRLEFEKAARLRDQMRALERVMEKQRMISTAQEDQDVVGMVREGAVACVQLFLVRGGKLLGSELFYLDAAADEDPPEIVSAFLQQHYADATSLPKTILLPVEIEDAAVVEEWLSGRKGARVRLHTPQRGEKKRLVEMAEENAKLELDEHLSRENRRIEANQIGLQQLQEVLGLPAPPRRIEAYDISNFQGREAVGSMVVLEDGVPNPSEYRRFRIKGVEGPNDFAMMNEVVRRRFTRGLKEREELKQLSEVERLKAAENARFARLPDLILIDGGKGQLSAAQDALRDLDLEHLPILGLAKRLEEIFVEDDPEPVRLRPDSPGLHLLQRVRDEAHRFALSYHRQLRDARTSRSVLDEIEGVGPKRKRSLLRTFGSVKGVRQASLAELKATPGIPAALAERIYNQLHSE